MTPMTRTTPAALPRPAAHFEPSLARSSRVMALGTIASRGTGFIRNIVLVAALGLGALGDAYTVANTVPNIIYDLLLGGVLTSVVVPLLVRAAHLEADNGEAYAQRLLSLVTYGLGAVVVVAVVLAPYVVDVYAHDFTAPEYRLAVVFARFFLPQILFYGVGATMGAILNARGHFAAPMWAPVLNNVVVVATGLLYLAEGGGRDVGALTTTQTLTLSVGTTLGIIAQTLALLPALRRVGFSLRPRINLRGVGLRHAGRLAGWVVVYVAASQVAYLVVARLATGAGHGPYVIYTNAYLLFQLPYAVVAVSVVTALLPRMSRHAVRADLVAVGADLSTGLRLTGALLVPASVGFIVFGPRLATLFLAHGNTTLAEAQLAGGVLAAFGVALVPFAAYQVMLRAFYALQDTKTPALVSVGVAAVSIAVNFAFAATLTSGDRVIGLALGFAASYVAGLAAFVVLLRRRLGCLDGYRVMRTHVRLVVAALLSGLVGYGLRRLLGLVVGPGWAGSLVVVAVAGGIAVAVFVGMATRMRVAEVRGLRQLAHRRVVG